MDDCFALAESRASRVAYNGESGGDRDPFSFHQGAQPKPDWDPYSFHQEGKPGTKPGTVTPLPTDTNPGPKPPEPTPTKPGDNVPKPTDTVPLPPLPDQVNPREVKLADGAVNRFDAQGRVVLTAAADGSKVREVRYEDQADPQRVTQVIIDQNRVYTRNSDGQSWDYAVNGRPSGTWYGDIHMSKQGEYSFEDASTGAQRKFAPNTKEITPTPQPGPSDEAAYRPGDCTTYQTGCGTYYTQPAVQYREQVVRQGYQSAPYVNPGDPYIYHPGGGNQPYRPQPGQPEIYQPGNPYQRPNQNDWARYYNPNHPGYVGEQNCNPGRYYNPGYNQQYYDQRYNQQYYNPGYNQHYYDQRYNQHYYDQRYNQHYYDQRYNQHYYDQRYNQQYYNPGCSSGYYRPHNGNVAAQIGAGVVSGLINGAMYRGGFYPGYGGYYPGYRHGGYYGGGNVGGMVGSIIGSAIMRGGHHRRCW